jgi:DNA polymerase-3 subunit gamma/tau
VFELLHALTAHDAEGLLRRIAELDEFAPSYADVLQQMLTVLHHMALAQWAPDAIRHDEDAEAILGLAGMLSPEDVQLFYQIALIGQRDLPLAPEPRCGFEMILLRMLAFRPASLEERPGPVALAPKPLPAPSKSAAPPASAYPAATVDKPADRVSAPVAPVRQVAESSAAQDWPSLIRAMGLVGLTQQLANNCLLEEINEQRVNLILDARFAQIRTPQLEAKLESLLQTHFGKPLKLSIRIETPTEETPALQSQRLQAERQKAAEAEIEADENVRAFMERFDARIVPGSIKPLDQPKE